MAIAPLASDDGAMTSPRILELAECFSASRFARKAIDRLINSFKSGGPGFLLVTSVLAILQAPLIMPHTSIHPGGVNVMKVWCSCLLLVAVATVGAWMEVHAGDIPEFNRDPGKAQVITADLERFWKAWDLAMENPEQRREIFQREYLDKGSEGLQDFIELRIGDVDKLLSAIDAAPRFYASVRDQMDHASALEAPVRESLYRFKELLPEAVFPDTYLLIGALNSGGTIHRSGLLIGFEMNARGPETPMDELGPWHHAAMGSPETLPQLIVHELVHIQQAVYGRLDFVDLLGQSISEGAADFITHRVMGSHPMQEVHDWALPRETELWAEFSQVMHGTDTGGWLYDGNHATDRPADLGYFIGYRIVEAYHDGADDKASALREIVAMKDPVDFLDRSGYRGGVSDH